MSLAGVVLAAGLGTRMKSRIPKMLHPLGGKPLLSWAISAAEQASGAPVLVVIGPEAQEIRRELGAGVEYAVQAERLGTGHALLQAANILEDKAETILVVNGDLPLVRVSTLLRLVQAQQQNDGPMCLLTAVDEDQRGFGRIVRNPGGEIEAIIEEAQATEEQRAIHELNVGAYCFQAEWLWTSLNRLPLSPKGEYYLTDLVGLAREKNLTVRAVEVETLDETIGVNTRAHLAQAERALRQRINLGWLEAGVSMQDPATIYIDQDVTIGTDTTLLANTHLTGTSQIGAGCTIGPNTTIRDSIVGENCVITSSVLEGAQLEDEVQIGPFAHLRQGANLGRGVHMGNFGEVKNSRLEAGVKMGHFSYIGDAHIGENTNIGAGTITCNFDGEHKNKTEIGANVFIGSDTMLVAPLKIGEGSRTGAGSVVTKDIPPNSLAVGAPARVIRKLGKSD